MSALLQQMKQDSPYAVYPLLDDVGTVARDAVGSQHGTYVSGYTLANGPGLFKGVHLAGEAAGTGAVTFPNGNLATMALANATIEWWMRPTVAPNGYEILGLTSGGGWSHPLQFQHRSENAGGVRVVAGTGPTSEVGVISAAALIQNAWNHIVVKFTNNDARIGINNVFENMSLGPRSAHGSNLMWLGWREGSGGQRGTTGHYAYLATYPSALSDARCTAHYKAGLREKVLVG